MCLGGKSKSDRASLIPAGRPPHFASTMASSSASAPGDAGDVQSKQGDRGVTFASPAARSSSPHARSKPNEHSAGGTPSHLPGGSRTAPPPALSSETSSSSSSVSSSSSAAAASSLVDESSDGEPGARERHARFAADDDAAGSSQSDWGEVGPSGTAAIVAATPMLSKQGLNDMMVAMQLERRRKRYWRDFSFYLLFLFLILLGQFLEWQVTESYFFQEGTREQLINEEFTVAQTHIKKTYHDIGQIDEFWEWLQGPVPQNLFPDGHNNGRPFTPREVNYVALQNKLVGRIRLRQMRVRSGPCQMGYGGVSDSWSNECFPPYTEDVEDRSKFGRVEWLDADETGTHAWQSAATYASYSASGHVVDIPADEAAFRSTIEQLRDDMFIDRATRAIFFNVNLYNQNLDMYQSVQLLFEFLATGAIVTHDVRIITNRIDPFFTAADQFRAVVLIVTLVFLTYYLGAWLFDYWTSAVLAGWRPFLANFWNVLLFINIVAYFVVFFMRVAIIAGEMRQTLLYGDEGPTADEYFPIEVIMNRFTMINAIMSLNILLSFLGSFRFLQVNPQLNFLWTVLTHAWPDLVSFLFLFFILFSGFSIMGHMLWGTVMWDFRSYWNSSFALARMVSGDFNYAEMELHHPTFAPIFFNLFMVVVYFILINMFLAIINDSFAVVNSTPRQSSSLVRTFKKFCSRLVRRLQGKEAKREVKHAKRISHKKLLVQMMRAGLTKKSVITVEDLQEALGPDAPADLAHEILATYDKDKSGTLEASELINMADSPRRDGGDDSPPPTVHGRANRIHAADDDGAPRSRTRSLSTDEGEERFVHGRRRYVHHLATPHTAYDWSEGYSELSEESLAMRARAYS